VQTPSSESLIGNHRIDESRTHPRPRNRRHGRSARCVNRREHLLASAAMIAALNSDDPRAIDVICALLASCGD